MILLTCGYWIAWAVASARRTFHHRLLAPSALIPMVSVPRPVSHDAWRRQVSRSLFWSGVSGTDATANVFAITGSSCETGTSAKRAFLIVALRAFWSTDAAVIMSPDAAGAAPPPPPPLCGAAVVFEHAASNTAATAAATSRAAARNRAGRGPREDAVLILSPLTGVAAPESAARLRP